VKIHVDRRVEPNEHVEDKQMTRCLVYVGLISLLAAATTGCNTSQTGAEGLVRFTPDACDRAGTGCDFDDGVAVGGTLDVWITGTDGTSTAGFTLRSDDPAVITVTVVDDVAGRPTWELAGTGSGVARLIAVDADGADVDFIEVAVQELDGLRLVQTLGEAVGPTSDGTYGEIWQVNANEETWFYVEPLVGGERIMGILEYDVTIDADLEDNGLAGGSDISGGLYKLDAPAGDYALSVVADNGTALDVLFQVQ